MARRAARSERVNESWSASVSASSAKVRMSQWMALCTQDSRRSPCAPRPGSWSGAGPVRGRTDAFAHRKFIGSAGHPGPLFEAAGLSSLMDDGFISLDEQSAADFVSRCAELRSWPRQAATAARVSAAM